MQVALAEDGGLFREGLLMLLNAAGHEVVACAVDGDELISMLRNRRADVAILDIRMPPEPDGGLATAEVLRAAHPDLGLLLLSHYAELHYLMRLLDIGTTSIGYRLKEKIGSVEVLTDTLTRIAAGEIVIEPTLAKRLVAQQRGEQKIVSAELSEREVDVLHLMAEGRSNNGVAGQLSITPKTVEKHISSIFEKLELPNDTAMHHRRVLAVLSYLGSRRH